MSCSLSLVGAAPYLIKVKSFYTFSCGNVTYHIFNVIFYTNSIPLLFVQIFFFFFTFCLLYFIAETTEYPYRESLKCHLIILAVCLSHHRQPNSISTEEAAAFPRQYWRRATRGHTRGTRTPCFHGFTKRLFEVGLKEMWSCNNFAGRVENQSRLGLSRGGTDAMSAGFHRTERGVEEQQEAADRKCGRCGGGGRAGRGGQRGWRRTTESWGAEGAGRRTGGREAKAERLPPALSQPHAWLLLPLIVIAVQTRPTAATNISRLIWHTHVRSPMDTHAHTHTHTHTHTQTDWYRSDVSLLPCFMAPCHLAFLCLARW